MGVLPEVLFTELRGHMSKVEGLFRSIPADTERTTDGLARAVQKLFMDVRAPLINKAELLTNSCCILNSFSIYVLVIRLI